jgi:hypothetical protein
MGHRKPPQPRNNSQPGSRSPFCVGENLYSENICCGRPRREVSKPQNNQDGLQAVHLVEPKIVGAEEGTRTPTSLRTHGPEPCASANSATSALSCHDKPSGLRVPTTLLVVSMPRPCVKPAKRLNFNELPWGTLGRLRIRRPKCLIIRLLPSSGRNVPMLFRYPNIGTRGGMRGVFPTK